MKKQPYQPNRNPNPNSKPRSPRGSSSLNHSNATTSWGKVNKWYSTLVGESGHYFHEHVIFPAIFKDIKLSSQANVLDLGCGEGVLERKIPKEVRYTGVDVSSELILLAKRKSQNQAHQYIVKDATRPIDLKTQYSHAFCILAIQNMKYPGACIQNASNHLEKGGEFVVVLNHPHFRIPRQSSWEIDEKTKMQSRKINRYLSPLEVPIEMNPGGRSRTMTWSYHFSLAQYASWLKASGFVITDIQEWISDKKSVGKAATMENRAREEFPMFMGIFARKM